MSRISDEERAAGNGILNRRIFLERALVAGAAGMSVTGASAEPLTVPNWSKQPGKGFDAYGQPSSFEKAGRMIPPSPNPATQGVGASRTPHHLLDGMITPSGLHFERSHSGIPDIDPAQHRLVIHGLVRRPLVFTMEQLERYPRRVPHRLRRMRRQFRCAQCPAGASERERRRHPRAGGLFGLDRRAALDPAR